MSLFGRMLDDATTRAEKAEAALKLAEERNAALREACKPFVEWAGRQDKKTPDNYLLPFGPYKGETPTVGDLRKLAAAAKEGGK